jgi:hypothetical protein
MKPLLSLRNTAFAALLFMAATTQAQQQPALQQVAKANPVSATVKEPALGATTAAKDEIVLDGLKLRNEKMHQHFITHFKNATNIAIFPYAKSTVIYCMVNGIRNNILYTNKGKLEHTVRYYEAKFLPEQISSTIEEGFPGYQMTNVAEVTANGQTAHLVNIENKKTFKTIRVLDGNCDVYEDYNKQQ